MATDKTVKAIIESERPSLAAKQERLKTLRLGNAHSKAEPPPEQNREMSRKKRLLKSSDAFSA